MPVGCVGATDVRHVAIISYWSLNDGLPVPAAKNFQTPFYAPFLRFRWFNAATPSTCYKPEPAITAGNFPPVMAREQRTVSNESHVQTPIQRKLVTFRDSPRWLCRNLLMTDDDAIVAGSAVAVLTWMAKPLSGTSSRGITHISASGGAQLA